MKFSYDRLIADVDELVMSMMRKMDDGSGRWRCVPCSAECRDKTDCRRHVESKHVHADVICPICFNSYKTRDTFARHMLKMHKGVPFK